VTDSWDLLVVGSGIAGIVAAKTAVSFGARVALIEQDRTGGDCLWTGCVPSKALLAAAGHACTCSTVSGRTARRGPRRGAVRAAGVASQVAVLDRRPQHRRQQPVHMKGRWTARAARSTPGPAPGCRSG
jgi:pyruvate/2-oxoglutarate dehydrogenase complex dihydrolipoamide dehydrogenase (E3) component